MVFAESIQVWDKTVSDDTMDTTWKLCYTSAKAGRWPDETHFFRVMREHAKHYFFSPDAYVEFMGGIHTFDDESRTFLVEAIRAWHSRRQDQDTDASLSIIPS